MKLTDRDLLVVIIAVLVALAAAYRVDFAEGVVTFTVLWAAYLLGRSHPPD